MLPVLLDRKDHAKTSCAFNKLKLKEFHKPFSFVCLFVCLFLNSYTRERGNNRDINDNDNDHDYCYYHHYYFFFVCVYWLISYRCTC